MAKTRSIYKQIQSLRERFFKSYDGKKELLRLISEAEIAELVYNSNAIENSTLTLDETEKILQKINTNRIITQRELFEAKNLAKVMAYADKKALRQTLEIDVILFLHKILLSNIRDEIAGRFRAKNEYVRVGSHIAPPPSEVLEKIRNLLWDYQATPHLHIIERIARFHLEFEYIHPFVDGNGRMGRCLNNYLLIREGYVPINIQFKNRDQYYTAFKEYDKKGETSLMEEIVGKALTNSYYKRLAYLENKKIMTLSEYSKKYKLSHSNLLNKAQRQTIEAFLDRGIWKIGR